MKPTLKFAILLISVAVAFAAYRVLKTNSDLAPSSSTPSTGAPTPPTLAVQPGNLLIDSHWAYYQNNGAIGSKEVLSPAEAGLSADSSAVRIHIDKIPKQIFDIGYSYHFDNVAFREGEQVTFRFKARASAKNLIAPQMQRDSPPEYAACWTKFITLTPQWQDYSYTFTTPAYDPKGAAMVFKLGQSVGNIDIADISIVADNSPATQTATTNSPVAH